MEPRRDDEERDERDRLERLAEKIERFLSPVQASELQLDVWMRLMSER